jgi:fructose-bisphosphate aldolase class 1
MFEETLYQSTADGKPFVDVLKGQGIMPGIKVDTGEDSLLTARFGFLIRAPVAVVQTC